jgi:hypothetical protein
MGLTAFSLLAAAALCALGELRGQPGPGVALLLLWGLVVLRAPTPRGGLGALALSAGLVRLVLLWSEPNLSDDLARYLWEGRVVALGESPYLHAPASPHWAARFAEDPQRIAVNHPTIPSIYPPLALYLWAFLSKISSTTLFYRMISAAADLGVALTLGAILQGRGRSLRGAWLYALMPLMAVESAGSGHLEPLALLPAALAVRAHDRGGSGAAWAAVGAAIKLLPGVIFVGLARRSPGVALLAVGFGIAITLPFLSDGPALLEGLGAYAARWSFNGRLAPLLAAGLGQLGLEGWARPVGIGLGAGVCAWALQRRRDPAELWLWAGGAFVLLSPTVHPWYLGWAWVPALLLGRGSWSVLAWLIPLCYVVLGTIDEASGAWAEPAWTAPVIYGGFGLAALWGGVQRLRSPARLGAPPAEGPAA